MNKAEYPKTVTAVQSPILNYQPNYNDNRNSKSFGAINQLVYAQRRKTGDDKGDKKKKNKRSRRNLDHITCNNCGEKVRYAWNSECSTEISLKEDVDAFIKMKQENPPNKPPGGG